MTQARTLIPLAHLQRAAERRATPWNPVEFTNPIDNTKPFACETLTPLFYTPIYCQLTPPQKLRYNQLAALSFNEIITFFEDALAGSVLTSLAKDPTAPEALRSALHDFQRDEAEHTAVFRRLNQHAAPQWYSTSNDHIVRISPRVHRMIRIIGRRPLRFPFIFWIMLAMEERALELSRRCLHLDIEPHFGTVYRAHMQDEARHVQMDWHLIRHYFAPMSRIARKFNARMFGWAVKKFLLTPKHAGMRVAEVLAKEFPELQPRLPEIRQQLAALEKDPAYHAGLFSRKTTPILFGLMDEFPEFHPLQRILVCYQPQLVENQNAGRIN